MDSPEWHNREATETNNYHALFYINLKQNKFYIPHYRTVCMGERLVEIPVSKALRNKIKKKKKKLTYEQFLKKMLLKGGN